jgi:hypothetical protein
MRLKMKERKKEKKTTGKMRCDMYILLGSCFNSDADGRNVVVKHTLNFLSFVGCVLEVE